MPFPKRARQHHSLLEYLLSLVLAFLHCLRIRLSCQSQQRQRTLGHRWTPTKTLRLLLILSKLLMVVVAVVTLKVVQAMTTSRSRYPLVGIKNTQFFCFGILTVSFAVIPTSSTCRPPSIQIFCSYTPNCRNRRRHRGTSDG